MLRKLIAGVIGGLALLVGGLWLGLQVQARSFETVEAGRDLGTRPLPTDLPAPVARFARAIFGGDELPVVESALLAGRAQLRFNGLGLNTRFKFSHLAPNHYYHYIQAAWFGLPVATINERYLDGQGIMDIPGLHVENDSNISHAANQGFWSEALAWSPSFVFSDARVRWEAIDDTSARMIVPDADAEEHFLVRFDTQTGLMTEVSTERYQDPAPAPRRRWTNRVVEWGTFNGVRVPVRAETQWDDDPPWALWHIEQVVYNLPVTNRLHQFGGEYPED